MFLKCAIRSSFAPRRNAPSEDNVAAHMANNELDQTVVLVKQNDPRHIQHQAGYLFNGVYRPSSFDSGNDTPRNGTRRTNQTNRFLQSPSSQCLQQETMICGKSILKIGSCGNASLGDPIKIAAMVPMLGIQVDFGV